MDKIKTVKIKLPDGSVSEETYTISVDAKDVDMKNGKDLQDTIGDINVDRDGSIAEQLGKYKDYDSDIETLYGDVDDLEAADTELENDIIDLQINKINKTDIVDNLDSSSNTKVLSANQGKVLGDAVAALDTDIKKKAYFFDTVAAMKTANLHEGDYVCTLGYYTANDGGGAEYKVRTIASGETTDDMFIIESSNEELVEELIIGKEINVLKLGIKKDGVTDNSTKLQSIINKLLSGTLYFPKGKYIFNTNIDCSGKNINFKGDFDYTYTGTSNFGLCFDGINGFINTGRIYFDRLIIQDTTLSHIGDGIKVSGGTRITKCCIVGFANAINSNYHSVVAENNNMHYNNRGIYRPIDSRIINNTINANENDGIYLDEGCNDNIVTNNKIEWNKRNGIGMYKCTNCVISNNIIDRQTQYGISINNCSKNIISSNFLRRNNTDTTVSNNNCQMKVESCNNIIIENNEFKKGNTLDDGSGVVVPVYALYIVYSHDMLFMGNDFQDSCTEATPIKQYQNTGGIQFFDLGYDILSYLKGEYQQGKITDGTLTLQVNGTKANSSGYVRLDKFNYYVRQADLGFYEAGTLELSNFPLWGSDSSTSAKCNKSTIANGDINISVTFNRETSKYSVTFTSSKGLSVRLEPIYI